MREFLLKNKLIKFTNLRLIMTDSDIRTTFITLSQAMNIEAQPVATQTHAMEDQANQEVGPNLNQNGRTMASHLRDFTRTNPPMFFGSKVNEDP